MKITVLQQQILAEIDLTSDVALASTARKLKIKVGTLQYQMQRLFELGLVTKRVRVDCQALGFLDYVLYLNLGSITASVRRKFENELIQNERVGWLGRLNGSYQYGAHFYLPSLKAIPEEIYKLESISAVPIVEKVFVPRFRYVHFNLKVLANKPILRKIEINYDSKIEVLDEIDHLILKGLANSNFISLRETARQLKMPFATLDYRFQKLLAKGIIKGIFHEVDPTPLGFTSFRLMLTVRNLSQSVRQDFLNFCAKHPNITIYLETIGSWDFEVVVITKDTSQLLAINSEISEFFGVTLINIKTVQDAEDLKWNFYPFKNYQF